MYGKMFSQVQRCVGTKSTKEVIEFYYVWKMTSHYDAWKASFEPVDEVESSSEEEEEGGGAAMAPGKKVVLVVLVVLVPTVPTPLSLSPVRTVAVPTVALRPGEGSAAPPPPRKRTAAVTRRRRTARKRRRRRKWWRPR